MTFFISFFPTQQDLKQLKNANKLNMFAKNTVTKKKYRTRDGGGKSNLAKDLRSDKMWKRNKSKADMTVEKLNIFLNPIFRKA